MATFKRTTEYYGYSASDILAYNLHAWMEYGLLELGAYTPIQFDLPTSGFTNLERSYDNSLGGEGRVYEGFGPSWVWQSGVTVPSGHIQPFEASGVWVNGTFYNTSTTTGSYSHKIDFRTGRVIFDDPIDVKDDVQCEYVMNDVDIALTDSPQWKAVLNDYVDRFDNIYQHYPSGLAGVLKENRVWMPTVFINVDSRANSLGLQLGGGHINNFNVDYHIFANRPFDAKNLSDILNDEQDSTINLADVNSAPQVFNHDGTLASGRVEYPTLSDSSKSYFWTRAYIESSNGGVTSEFPNLYRADIQQSIEINRYNSTF